MACGAYHTLALSAKGEVFAFGDGESGALGLPDRGDASTHRAATPTLVRHLHDLRYDRSAGDDYGYESMDEDEYLDEDADDGSGRGVVASIAAGHLTSACVDRRGRLYTWGCPYAEDGVQPLGPELTPRRCGVAPKEPGGAVPGSGGGAAAGAGSQGGEVRFRSVGMGGYHTVVATEVRDRWGRPFDELFTGLPRGLQLPTAAHRARPSGEELEEERAAEAARVAEKERLEARSAAKYGMRGGKQRGPGGPGGGRAEDPLVGRLRVAPGAGAGLGPGRERPDYPHQPGRAHQALFVAPAIANPRRK